MSQSAEINHNDLTTAPSTRHPLFISIRLRIAVFLAAILIGGFAVYLLIASRLIISDKTSYIYDYSLSQVEVAAFKVIANPEHPLETVKAPIGFKIQVATLDPLKDLEQKLGEHTVDHFPKLEDLAPLVTGLREKGIRSGTNRFFFDNEYFLIAYKFVDGGKMIVLSIVPESIAFIAAQVLLFRSLVTGSCILAIAIGLLILFLKGLIMRLKTLEAATQEVANGNFTAKIAKVTGTMDEVTLLGSAFNLMSEKIADLIAKTADQARMEKELETAQLVQSKFFPQEQTAFGACEVAGKSLAASECGGDYWQYQKIGHYLIAVLGDATGHGVGAALVTALIHGAWVKTVADLNTQIEENKTELTPEKIFKALTQSLNYAICASAGDHSAFPSIFFVFDEKQNTLSVQNAGHPAPYLFNNSLGTLAPLHAELNPPLGELDLPKFNFKTIDFNQGDRIFAYTDGLSDERLSDGKKLKRGDISREIEALIKTLAQNDSGKPVIDHALQLALNFFGTDAKNRPDDITVLLLSKRG